MSKAEMRVLAKDREQQMGEPNERREGDTYWMRQTAGLCISTTKVGCALLLLTFL